MAAAEAQQPCGAALRPTDASPSTPPPRGETTDSSGISGIPANGGPVASNGSVMGQRHTLWLITDPLLAYCVIPGPVPPPGCWS